MKIYKVYERYFDALYHKATFEDYQKAMMYCQILNEPKESNNAYFVLQETLEFDDKWCADNVIRYVEVFSSDNFDEYDVNIIEEVIMNGTNNSIPEDDYVEFGDEEWSFSAYIPVKSFKDYNVDDIKDEFYRRLEDIKQLYKK